MLKAFKKLADVFYQVLKVPIASRVFKPDNTLLLVFLTVHYGGFLQKGLGPLNFRADTHFQHTNDNEIAALPGVKGGGVAEVVGKDSVANREM